MTLYTHVQRGDGASSEVLDAPAGACTYVYVFARVARAFTVCIIMYPEKK